MRNASAVTAVLLGGLALTLSTSHVHAQWSHDYGNLCLDPTQPQYAVACATFKASWGPNYFELWVQSTTHRFPSWFRTHYPEGDYVTHYTLGSQLESLWFTIRECRP